MPAEFPGPDEILLDPPPVVHWEFAGLTVTGRVRANNEDAIAFDPECGLAIVADGMGGYNAGEVASGMAVKLLRESFGGWLASAGAGATAPLICQALQLGIDQINTAIREAGQSNAQMQGMGTTLVLSAFGPRQVVVGHIGDSRCYRLRESRLMQLTRDHSMLQEQLDAGAISQREAARSPHRNLVTRALGIERQVRIETRAYPARHGDLFLLCSDGLSEMVGAAQLFTVLSEDIPLSQKVALLVAVANQNGGRDNISVVLVQAGEG